MNAKIVKTTSQALLIMVFTVGMSSCFVTAKKKAINKIKSTTYPSDVISFMDEWKILLGDGTRTNELSHFKKDDFFYVENDGETNWVVYKAPNSGITSKTSKNTRSELGQIAHWTPEIGGKLTGTLKVMHVSSLGDATKGGSYSVVVGQIHSDEGHENEPLKIFYKKFPGHNKGSVFWNYEINTAGDNAKRWDYSTAVWGHDMSVLGEDAITYPVEPENGIELGEEFSYEINVHKGIMYLTFRSEGHETVKFTKSLVKSDFKTYSDIPHQVVSVYASRGRDGVERENAYAGEMQYFKQGAYNQTHGEVVGKNRVSYAGSETYSRDIITQYANGCFAEVWFKEATLGEGTMPPKE